MESDSRTLRDIAKALKADGMQCNCDLDKWQPDEFTGHTHVCRIHKRAMAMKYRPWDLKQN